MVDVGNDAEIADEVRVSAGWLQLLIGGSRQGLPFWLVNRIAAILARCLSGRTQTGKVLSRCGRICT